MHCSGLGRVLLDQKLGLRLLTRLEKIFGHRQHCSLKSKVQVKESEPDWRTRSCLPQTENVWGGIMRVRHPATAFRRCWGTFSSHTFEEHFCVLLTLLVGSSLPANEDGLEPLVSNYKYRNTGARNTHTNTQICFQSLWEDKFDLVGFVWNFSLRFELCRSVSREWWNMKLIAGKAAMRLTMNEWLNIQCTDGRGTVPLSAPYVLHYIFFTNVQFSLMYNVQFCISDCLCQMIHLTLLSIYTFHFIMWAKTGYKIHPT